MVETHRDTISVNDCQILAHYQFEGDQYIITLESKEIADSARPGQFVHLSVSGMLAMRRPISIMSVDKENGTFDLLFKIVGEGTKQLAERKIGDVLSVIGPIGNGFDLNKSTQTNLSDFLLYISRHLCSILPCETSAILSLFILPKVL